MTLSWVDTTAPSTAFAPPAKVGPSNYNVTAGASDNSGAIAAYAWTVDSVAQGATGSVLSLSGLSNGTHSVSVRSRDAAGNWSGTVTKNVVVDKTVSASLSALPAITSAATVPLTFTKDADVVKTECALDGGAYAVCASGWSGISAATADGTHSYKVRATDDVGNVAETAAVSTTIDRTLPVLAFTDGPAEGQQVVTSNASITFSLVEARAEHRQVQARRRRVERLHRRHRGPARRPHRRHARPLGPGGRHRGQHPHDQPHLRREGPDLGRRRRDPDRRRRDPDRRRRQTPTGGGGRPRRRRPTPAAARPSTPQAPAFNVRFTHDYVYVGKLTKFTSLAIAGLPKTAKVTVACKGGGCTGKSKTLKHSGGKLNVLKALKALKLKSGAKLTITVRGEGNAQAIAHYVIRQGKRPTDTYRCAKAGGKLAAC